MNAPPNGTGPSSADLCAVLQPTYRDRVIRAVDARPYEYATSFGLTLVTVHFDAGPDDVLVLKDFDDRAMLPAARHLRREGPGRPHQEIDVYRHVIGPVGIGPRCQATVADGRRLWLFTELVRGVELWQVGDPSVWTAVARWLGGMHAWFAADLGRLDGLARWLPTCDRAWFESWHRRADDVLADSTDPRAAQLRRLIRAADLGDRLSALPRTFVHGELYPSNVMVAVGDGTEIGSSESTHHLRIVPIDWETAAIGPAMIDLAALSSGWDDEGRVRLEAAYGIGHDEEPLRWCRLHLALRSIGAPSDWAPPVQHRQDWIGVALSTAREVVA